MTPRPKKTPEERKEEANRLHAILTDKAEELSTSEGWLRYLDVAQKFHHYSFQNQLLILHQMRQATRVAGYKTWQSLGQQVKKGERGIKIFGYSSRVEKIENPDGTTTEERHVSFPILTVFDISQTEPMEGHTPISDLKPSQELTGYVDNTFYTYLETGLVKAGFTIKHQDTGDASRGYITPERHIVIKPDLSGAQKLQTLLHEAGHYFLGHVDALADDYASLHRGHIEVEADSASYIAAGILGLDTSSKTTGYILEWANGDLDLIRNTAKRVTTIGSALADFITDGIEPTKLPYEPPGTENSTIDNSQDEYEPELPPGPIYQATTTLVA